MYFKYLENTLDLYFRSGALYAQKSKSQLPIFRRTQTFKIKFASNINYTLTIL